MNKVVFFKFFNRNLAYIYLVLPLKTCFPYYPPSRRRRRNAGPSDPIPSDRYHKLASVGHPLRGRLQRGVLRVDEAAISPDFDLDGDFIEKVPESPKSVNFDEP